MSLSVWLPLNLDLRNLGLDSTNIVNNGAVLDSSSNSYKFDGTDDYLTCTYNATAEISFSLWVNFISLKAAHLIDARVNNVGYLPLYIYGSSGMQCGNSINGFPIFNNCTWETNKWYHICITYDSTYCTAYVNGEQIGLSTSGKGYNFGNSKITLCSRYTNTNFSNAKIYDFRIYDHALSAKEVKELSKGLVFHLKMINYGNGSDFDDSPINNDLDLSGFNNIILYWLSGKTTTIKRYGRIKDINHLITLEYPYSIGNFSDNSMYIKVKDLIESGQKEFSFSFWINPYNSTATGCIWNGRKTTEKGVAIFYLGGGIRFDDDSTLTLSSNISGSEWSHIVCTYKYGGQKCIYINGVLDKSVSAGAISDKNNQYATIGASMSADATPSGNNLNAYLNDYRIYRTQLSAEDVKELYNVGHIVDDELNIYSYRIMEDYYDNEKSELLENGNLHSNLLSETPIYSHFDSSIYTESDRSKWIRIFHHNNPSSASNLFSSSDDFTKPVYKNSNAWFDFQVCNYFDNIHQYEFLVKLKTTSDASELKWRWVLFFNPMTATWEQVRKPSDNLIDGNTTRIDTNEYSTWDTVYGGIYRYTTGTTPYEKTYLRQSNANSGNWWGACGANTQRGGGIPGFNLLVVTTGYLDVYIRIDNLFRFKKILTFTNSPSINGNVTFTGTEYKDFYVYSGKTTMYNGQLCYIWDMYDCGILKSSDYYINNIDAINDIQNIQTVKLLTNTLDINLPLTDLSSEYVATLNLDDSEYSTIHRNATILQSTEIPDAEVEIAENKIIANEFIEI